MAYICPDLAKNNVMQIVILQLRSGIHASKTIDHLINRHVRYVTLSSLQGA